MQHQNPYKKTKDLPNWLLNSLKGLLLVLFIWQFNQQIPTDYFKTAFRPPPPPIETIEYQQLQLSTLTPAIADHIFWGDQLIPYHNPNNKSEEKAPYSIPAWKMHQLELGLSSIYYKGQALDLKKINAIFYKAGVPAIICEQLADTTDCFAFTLSQLDDDYELWLALETKSDRTFFSKIKVGDNTDIKVQEEKEAITFWEQLLKKEKFKNIDDLSVAKPIFKNNRYLFKWGNWERHISKHNGEGRIKVDTATFKSWLRDQSPMLYSEGKFIPFNIQVGFWDRKRWDLTCNLSRRQAPLQTPENYHCLNGILEEAKVGDHISIYLYNYEDFLTQISINNLTGVPDFIMNGRRINLAIPIELTATPINPINNPLTLSTTPFSFQLQTVPGQAPIAKMDTALQENQTLFQHYQKSQNTKVIHIPHFKTIRRLVGKEDDYLAGLKIANTYTLMDTVYAVHTFPEFYDFDVLPPLIRTRGLSAVLDKTAYPLSDFLNYRDPFELLLGTEQVKLLQMNITIIPEEGDIIRYITDNPNRFDINRRLDLLDKASSIYFDDILFERKNGEQLAFPLAVAIHLK